MGDPISKKTTANPNRKAVICSSELKNKIEKYTGPDKDFFNFSDYTITACRYVLEMEYVQSFDEIRKSMLRDIFHKEVEWAASYEPIEPVDFIQKESESSGDKTLVTFPKGLLNDLSRVASKHDITVPGLVRYCLEYYLREYEYRKQSYADVDNILQEALEEVLKKRFLAMRQSDNQ